MKELQQAKDGWRKQLAAPEDLMTTKNTNS